MVDSTTLSTALPSPPDAARLSKRTQDALSSLDAAFKAGDGAGAAKKRKKSSPTLTSTPALEALLARSTSADPTQHSPDSTLVANYTPTSLPLLLSRLATYRLSSFSPSKPASLSSLSCALHGWLHTPTTRDRVQCVSCARGVVLLPPSAAEGGWTSPAGVKLKEEYEKALFSREAEESLHRETCPWRMRPCARSLYRLPGGGLGVKSGGRRKLLEELGREAVEMEELGLGEAALDLPKEAEDEKVRERLIKAVKGVAAEGEEQRQLSAPTLLLALFGWSLSPLPSSASSSSAPAPALSRSASSSSISSLRSLPPTTPILSCTFCNRQVLASSYLPSPSFPTTPSTKRFNPVAQHQPFCPFVDAYAGVPQPPPVYAAPSTAAAKRSASPAPLKPGWKVRLEAVLQRPITAAGLSGPDQSREGTAEEQEAGNEGGRAGLVGGKTQDLLSYVRNLLGPKTKALPSSRLLSLSGSSGRAGGGVA